jgi:two-component system KDP operon response regulator KdpE
MWRILIVDADRKYRKLLREHFERVGHVVVEAGEAGPAMRLAEAERPQAILLDFDLPDARGSTICGV